MLLAPPQCSEEQPLLVGVGGLLVLPPHEVPLLLPALGHTHPVHQALEVGVNTGGREGQRSSPDPEVARIMVSDSLASLELVEPFILGRASFVTNNC